MIRAVVLMAAGLGLGGFVVVDARAENGGDGVGHAELLGVLEAFGVDRKTQLLVFSKTGRERAKTGPEQPRAVYFGDGAYVTWVPGGGIEVLEVGGPEGARFLAGRRDGEAGFMLHAGEGCLDCHAVGGGAAVPLARSVIPWPDGRPASRVKNFDAMSATVPMIDRWGGWYVTGAGPSLWHLGNRTLDAFAGEGSVYDAAAAQTFGGLGTFFDTTRYLETGSDILALLVFDHQIGMHRALLELAASAGEGEPSPEAVERVVRELLFCDEAEFPLGDAEGDPEFRRVFRAGRKTDALGRSLRDFATGDGRLFQFRCSYVIGTEAFGCLPPRSRAAVLERLAGILESGDPPENYAHLGEAERRTIRTLLVAMGVLTERRG